VSSPPGMASHITTTTKGTEMHDTTPQYSAGSPLKRLIGACALASSLLFTGCVMDLNKLASDLQRPAVEFTHADQWRCEESVKIPDGAKVEDCSRCVNTSRGAETVAIAKVEQSVRSGGAVLLCPSRAWVADR
jgi:hypothetical protein